MRELYLLPEYTSEPWQNEAACGTVDPEVFMGNQSVDEALAVCAGCPVRQECDDYAVAHDERFGIWGGKVRSG